jgi:hypothetical protein
MWEPQTPGTLGSILYTVSFTFTYQKGIAIDSSILVSLLLHYIASKISKESERMGKNIT